VEANGDAQDCGALTEVRAKRLEREQAVDLRKRGLSYSEIQAKVPVSQASLSLWLRAVELQPCYRQRLAERKIKGQRLAAQTVHNQRFTRVASTLSQAEQEAKGLLDSLDMLWLIGTVLYWAEGTKVKEWTSHGRVTFTNMDPEMIRLVCAWLLQYCSVGSESLDYALYIHPDANIAEAQLYWLRHLGIPQIRLRTYFKRPNPSPHRKNIGRTYYGTMRITVRSSTILSHRITGWIHAIVRHCGVV
jgi:hypothetical protein